MTKHYAVGQNIQTGTIEFDGFKVGKVTFLKPFNKFPSVTLTLEDGGATHVPFRTKVKRTDFRIVFKTPYTGTVGWSAMER